MGHFRFPPRDSHGLGSACNGLVPRFICFRPTDSPQKIAASCQDSQGLGQAWAMRPFREALPGFQRPHTGGLWPGPPHSMELLVSQLYLQVVLLTKLFLSGRYHYRHSVFFFFCRIWLSPLIKEKAEIRTHHHRSMSKARVHLG